MAGDRIASRADVTGRALVVAAGAVLAAVVGWLLFVQTPDDVAELLGVVLTIGLVLVAVRVARSIAASRFPDYNVAEVAVEGPITRDGRSPSFPGGVISPGADEVVEQIEHADEDPNTDALLVKLNTPGGEVVPSDDIRRAAAAFDGPTIGYATDTCASGGYWIASGCDEFWARDTSVVGSIGVIGSTVNVKDLADRLGVSYERFAAGKYKDAGLALKEMNDDEREYLQGLIDDFYADFVERVAEGRDLDPAEIRETEARVYLGERARELGLVDELGTRDDVEDALSDRLDEPVSVAEFRPQRGLMTRFRGGAQSVAYALGAGIASQVAPEEGFEFEL
jgi:protease-4